MKVLREEIVLKGKLLETMQSQGKDTYRYEDLVITITPGEPKLKVKVLKDDEPPED